MIYVEDELIKLNGVVLPGLVKSIEVIETAKVDEQEVEGSATKPKQATGYEDAKVNIELIIDDTPSQTKYQRYATLRAIFRRPRRGEGHLQKAVPQGRKQARAAYGYAGAVGVHPADHHGKVQLQFRLRQVRRRRGEQSEGRLQELPEQRTGQVPRTG